MKPGIYHNVPFEEYKSGEGWKDCVHKSMFSHILKSGKALKKYIEKRVRPTPAMDFGNLVDCMLLEPTFFDDRYIVHPSVYPAVIKKGTKKKNYEDKETELRPWSKADSCKVWEEKALELNPGKKIISPEEKVMAGNIVSEIQSHPMARQWLSKAETQLSLYWIDSETDLPCKARLDFYPGNLIGELKVTGDVSREAFSKTMHNLKYHAGGAFYHDGLLYAMGFEPQEECSTPIGFIAAEAEEPFDIMCYTLGPLSFTQGRAYYKMALSRYKEFIETQEFTNESNISEEIEIPNYAINRYQYEGIVS